jgi:fused signal recognition particle receptor
MIAAADTFRAAAVEQLEIWAKRVESDFLKGQNGVDPSAVAFDAVRAAKARGSDILIIDTAGRLHTKTNLMDELKKIRRVIGRELEGAPHETLLVLDATTGQNAIQQAKIFKEAVEITGIILTKLDGTAKGGVIVAIADELKIPVKFIGIGERLGDLREFKAEEFVEALFLTGKEILH